MEAHARAVCEASRFEFTALRSAVLQTLWAAGTPLGAYELTRRVNLGLTKPLASNSVYRILDFLIHAGLARHIASRQAFVVVPPSQLPDAVLLLCDKCGRCAACEATVLPDLKKLAAAEGFKFERPIIEVAGTCASCVSREAI